MIFSKPIPFEEALENVQLRKVLPTSATSAELAAIAPEIRQRAFFSARTTNAAYLTRQQNLIAGMVSPETVIDPASGNRRPAQPGEYSNPATVRTELKQALSSIGYTPDPEHAGGLQDLGSDIRLNLIISTQAGLSRGYGNWRQAQNPAVLDMWPAQELYRAQDRKERRLWGQAWNDARARLTGRTSALPVDSLTGQADSGMYALKNDPIWTEISEFDLPYPIYNYNSGMRVRDVDRDQAIALGLITADAQVKPQDRPFNESAQVSIPEGIAPDLLTSLLTSLGSTIIRQGAKLILNPVAA